MQIRIAYSILFTSHSIVRLSSIFVSVFIDAGLKALCSPTHSLSILLYSLGGLCERIIGRKRFLWFYIISGIFAGLLFVFLAYFFGANDLGARIFGSPIAYAVGASGAIFAIAGLFVMLTPKLRFVLIFLPFFSLPAYIMVPAVLVITWLATAATGLPIGNTAHFGGFLIGQHHFLSMKEKMSTPIP